LQHDFHLGVSQNAGREQLRLLHIRQPGKQRGRDKLALGQVIQEGPGAANELVGGPGLEPSLCTNAARAVSKIL
jgi:hypothetical protein